MDAIRIENLTKYYRSRCADSVISSRRAGASFTRIFRTDSGRTCHGKSRGIENLSLSIQKGEFFGFIGPNGAGKSTTIRILLGLIRATSGSAFVNGMDIRKDRERILKEVGYLPSETAFYHGMRVRDILKLSADLRGKDCREAAARLCERLQLDPARRADELSLGNRKKTAIVCALQHDPELLILDEPTSGLDPLIQKEFFEILRERNAAGVTIFLSSHILSEVQRNCGRAAIIREGRIIACGSVEALARTDARRVTVRGTVELGGLSGVKDLQASAEGTDFLYNGDMHALLDVLSRGDIRDLSVSEPDLEEIFLHYYEDNIGRA